eukprot:CAMPEP_0197561768 /NCGR_PEP_ID=MMETSP1320-20131121/25811_1 /TAXON_ID=91990 /ORGANISM="Bolidomonas sp., Strain RCC2347" /LENGTH=36 /DNA_ID= /DNA_START= /DNA_END= /DNA_ORIENTATION=
MGEKGNGFAAAANRSICDLVVSKLMASVMATFASTR